MNRRAACSVLSATVASFLFAPSVFAEPPKPISISVDDMHCAQCAKKITERLKTVVGVKGASTDVKAGTVVVTAHPGKNPSPRALWEAVERAGFKPTKIETAAGSSTTKPRA